MNLDNDSGFGLGFLFDLGSFGGVLLFVAVLAVGLYCGMVKKQENLEFCTEVCGQYGDVPVMKDKSCFCRDEQGIYDPAMQQRSTHSEKP